MALSKSNRFWLYLIGFIAGLYAVQWLMEIIFSGWHNDPTAQALRPLQNHYLSSSKYYITTEGGFSEFTSDSTGVGRMFVPLLLGAVLWFILSAIISFIKPLKNAAGTIVLFIGIVIFVSAAYSAFFAPPRKATFDNGVLTLEETNSYLGFAVPSGKKASVKFSEIDSIQYEFNRSGGYDFTALSMQIIAVISGKHYLIGENEVPSNSTYKPSDEQKKEAQKYVDLLTKLIGK